ncbi:MAG: hypothetical protein HQL02_11050 [Nitrospirae bacterium]|nr:hypothetical protein [Nitrospirota bacterium]
MKSKWFKHILFCMVMVSILLTYNNNLMAFSGKVHKRITEKAILQNKAEISNYITGYTGLKGFKVKVRSVEILKLIKDSNDAEDALFTTPNNLLYSHFYNPLTNSTFPNISIPSAYARANESSNQYSWSKARLYFYQGLTSSGNMDRTNYFYKAFEALGHVVHLIQDVAVPAHTRLDLHGPLELFEWYTSVHIDDLVYDQVPYRGLSLDSKISDAPLKLWDGDFYTPTYLPVGSNTVGLAEYSAANFFSEGTIFKGQPRPRLIGDTDCASKVMNPTSASIVYLPGGRGGIDYRIYVSKTFGDQVNNLAAFSILKNAIKLKGLAKGLSGDAICNQLVFLLDDAIHEDYAATLVPRAVGYSAALMDHFFRNQIEISLPDSGVYASVPNNGSLYPYPNMNFTQITLKAKNILLSGEDMSGGDVTLIVTYRIAQKDPFVTGPVDVSNEISHAIVTKSGVTIPKDPAPPVELTFDLTSNPIPILATDVYLQLAYKGVIGAKTDEVAFGYKDISEPTPADFFNNMDKICLNSNWYDAGSQAALAAVDSNGNRIANFWDVYAHNAQNFYLRYSTLDNPINASSTEKIASVPLINAGEHKRVLYFLSDYEFNYSLRYSAASTATGDTFRHPSNVFLFQGTGIKRQTEFMSGYNCDQDIRNCYVQMYPAFYRFRNVDMWGGSGAILTNNGYPTDDCPISQLSPVLNPSTPATEQSQPQDGVTVGVPVYVEPRFITLQR